MRKELGSTFFELLLVVSLMSVLGALSSPFLSRFLSRNYLEDTTEKIVKTLRKAQIYALSARKGSSWGVHYGDHTLTLFKGISYGEDTSFNEEFKIPATINIAGWSDIIFSKIRGQPSTALTVFVTSGLGSKTVILNAEGMVNVQ